MSTLNRSFKTLMLIAFAIGSVSPLNSQFTEDRGDTLTDKKLVAEASPIETQQRSFHDIDEFLPEDHRSNTIIFRDAQFDGGKKALRSYLQNNFRYPDQARQNGHEGRMVAQFTVNREGQVTDVQITRSAGKALDDELVRVIESMPNWNPAVKYGYAAKSVVLLPFKASLK